MLKELQNSPEMLYYLRTLALLEILKKAASPDTAFLFLT